MINDLSRKGMIGAAALVIGFISGNALAQDSGLPAVSGINGYVEAAGGYDDNFGGDDESHARFHGAGQIKIPLGHSFGAGLDGTIGEYADELYGGGTLTLFTRDPDLYMVGIVGQYMAVDDNDIWRVGPTGALYLDRFSLEGYVGFEGTDDFGDDAFLMATAGFYPIDNLRLSAGYKRYLDLDVGLARAEWLLGDMGLPISIFAQGEIGDHGYDSAFAGIRFYFSESGDKSLIRRHREDDNVWNYTTQLPRVEHDGFKCPSEFDERYYDRCFFEQTSN